MGAFIRDRLRPVKTLAATGAETLTTNDIGVIIVPNTAAKTVNLPTAVNNAGLWFTFVKTTSDAAAITVDPASTQTVGGASTNTAMDAQYDTLTIVSDGANWQIIAQKIA